MFEYFGVKDIFVSLWKHKRSIIGVACIVAIVCAGKTYIDNTNSVENVSYTATGQYFFNSVLVKNNGSKAAETIEYSGGQIAVIYKNMINSQNSREYIANYVNNMGDSITASEIQQYVTCAIAEDGFMLNITVNAPDKDVVVDLFDAYSEYFSVYQDKLYNEDLNSFSCVGVSEIQEIKTKNTSNVGKAFVSGFVVGLFLSCVCIVIYYLFNPTINRKNDFEMLGVVVLGKYR